MLSGRIGTSMLEVHHCVAHQGFIVGMVVKVSPRLRVLHEYSLQGRLTRHEYWSPRPITPRVISA
ncbi:hypothetical protein Hanom_Chr01g00032061 [Helianthus anomalus]